MKLGTFSRNGRVFPGLVNGETVTPLTSGGEDRTLRHLLAVDDLETIVAQASAEAIDIGDVDHCPVIVHPEKVLCIGINYHGHAAETGRGVPDNPELFVRLPGTLLGHNGVIPMPAQSRQLDFEGELAIVIGRAGFRINPEDALDHVAGYTCFNDVSVRDFQKHSLAAGKNFPGTAPVGPWLVTRDAIPDPSLLQLTTRLNGAVVQSARIELIFPVPVLIAYLSSIMPLEPGDIIATGTPSGVGVRRNPALWMAEGDNIDVEISGIGTLRNQIGPAR